MKKRRHNNSICEKKDNRGILPPKLPKKLIYLGFLKNGFISFTDINFFENPMHRHRSKAAFVT